MGDTKNLGTVLKAVVLDAKVNGEDDVPLKTGTLGLKSRVSVALIRSGPIKGISLLYLSFP